MNEARLREELCLTGRTLVEQGLSGGASGNMSVRLEETVLVTPTGYGLGELEPGELSLVDFDGRHISGPRPTKETFLHLALYAGRPSAGAVLHTHSTYSVAVSCLADVDPDNVIPPITPYFVMRVGRVCLVEYFRPGDPAMGEAVVLKSGKFAAILLANHGPVVSGKDLGTALKALEELEEAAKIHLLLKNHKIRLLDPEQIKDLKKYYPEQ